MLEGDHYGIFQKAPKNNNRGNFFYIYSLDCRFNDVTSFHQIGDCD